MMNEIIKTAIEFLKLAPHYLTTVALISGALLFAPAPWLEHLGTTSLVTENRQWLGLAFITSTVLCLVAWTTSLWRWLRKSAARRSRHKHTLRRLHELTEDEKQILRYFLAKNTRANTLRLDDGVVQGLVRAGIIYRSAAIGNLLEGFAHNISDVAWDYLHEHPELLLGATNTYRNDELAYDW
jgi:hypothetical protein